MNTTRRSTVQAIAAIALSFAVLPAIAQTSAALQKLLDRAEIEELVARYVTALDTRDAEAYASVFTEDAVFDVDGTVYNGRDEIRAIVTGLAQSREQDLAAGRTPASLYHVMSNTSIEIVDASRARHTSYAQTVRQAEDGQFVVGFMGRYEDQIVKRDGRWQIQSRKLVSFIE